MAVRGLNSENSSARVAREQVAEISIDPGFIGKGFLSDEIEPIVCQSRAELLARIPSRKLHVKTDAESREPRVLCLLVEVPFDAQVEIACAAGTWNRQSASNGQIRSVDVNLQVVRQAVVQLVVSGVLAEIRILGMLKAIVLIEEFKVPLALLSDGRIIRVKGQLGRQGTRDADRAKQ